MRYLVVETTKSESGYANYVKEYSDLDRAKREYFRFLSQMVAEASVLYCMASVVDEVGQSVMRESWFAPEPEEEEEVTE